MVLTFPCVSLRYRKCHWGITDIPEYLPVFLLGTENCMGDNDNDGDNGDKKTKDKKDKKTKRQKDKKTKKKYNNTKRQRLNGPSDSRTRRPATSAVLVYIYKFV